MFFDEVVLTDASSASVRPRRLQASEAPGIPPSESSRERAEVARIGPDVGVDTRRHYFSFDSIPFSR